VDINVFAPAAYQSCPPGVRAGVHFRRETQAGR
jgi:hypothetical protein